MVSTATYATLKYHLKPYLPAYSIQTLLFTVAPLLLPRLITYYHTARASTASQSAPIRAVPPKTRRALNLLFLSAALAFLSTLPYFAPENIFTLTSSRLQTPTDVLFTRLSALRPPTPTDAFLRTKLVSLESRLLYLSHGPDALATCAFCTPTTPESYTYYALPTLLLPHLLHLLVLGAATSSTLTGRAAKRKWRTPATLAALALAGLDIYALAAHDHRANARALRPADLDPFHWRMRTFRGLAVAVLDGALAYALYLSSTNRMFVTPPSVAERVEAATRVLEATQRKLGAVGIVRNVVVRDEPWRRRAEAYWLAEGAIMREVFEEREALEAVNGAVASGRVELRVVEAEAASYAERVTGGFEVHTAIPA